jgi:hypothetical protein
MIEEYQKWLEYLAHVQHTFNDKLAKPIYHSVSIAFGELKFNQEIPLDDHIKNEVIETFNLIYNKNSPVEHI